MHLVGYFHNCITMHGFMNVYFKQEKQCTYDATMTRVRVTILPMEKL